MKDMQWGPLVVEWFVLWIVLVMLSIPLGALIAAWVLGSWWVAALATFALPPFIAGLGGVAWQIGEEVWRLLDPLRRAWIRRHAPGTLGGTEAPPITHVRPTEPWPRR